MVQKTTKSCDCLSAEIDREVIPAGEAANVTLEVKPGDLVYKQAHVSILTGDGRSHHFQLRTWTYPPVMLNDGRDLPIALGQLVPGSRTVSRHRLAVLSTSETPPPELRFVPAERGEVHCTLTDRGVEPFADGRFLRRKYDLDVAVTAGNVPGLVMRPVEFVPGPEAPEAYRFQPMVTWTVGSPVSIDPPRWMVKRDELESPGELRFRFRLRDRELRPLRVAAVESSHPGLRVQPVELAGNSSPPEFDVALDRNGLPSSGTFLGTVRLQVEILNTEPTVSVFETFKVIVPPIVSAAEAFGSESHAKGN